MNLLKAVNYDPATAVSKATSALLAMTAFDTTNLRLAVTVPAHGMVRFRLQCNLSGATTMPQVLLGVLNGATVVGRQVPLAALPGTALATTNVPLLAEFTATGLTPGAANFDAAYGVETIVASTNIHYGGPNNTTGNDAWGGFVFEAWDPQPQQTNGQLVVDSNGRVDISKVAGTTQTARDLGGQLDATISSRMATFTLPTNFSALAITAGGAVTAGTVSDKTGYSLSGTQTFNLTGSITGNLSGSVGSVTGAVGAVTGNVGGSVASVTGAVGSVTGNVGGNVVGSVASVAGAVGSVTAAVTVGTNNDKTGYALTAAYDAAKTALPASSYLAPDNSSIATILGRTDVATSTRLAALSYTAPDSAATIADAVLTTPMTESYNAKGATATLAQIGYTLLSHIGEASIVGVTKTLFKLDGSTVAKTFTLNSATTPTAITRAT